MNSPGVAFLASAAVIGVLVVLLALITGSHPGGGVTPPLFVYCGADSRGPVESAAEDYENDYGFTANTRTLAA